MSTTKNTIASSPWSAYRDHRGHWYVRSASGQFLATMATGVNALDCAHARIMAAAPQLLASLQDLLLCPELNFDDTEPETIAAIDRANKAAAGAGSEVRDSDSLRLLRAAPALLQALDTVTAWSVAASDDDFPYPIVEDALSKARGH